MNVFKLFYKSLGGKSTLPIPVEYNYPVAEIKCNNIQELAKEAENIIGGVGVIGEYGVDLLNQGIDYPKNRTNGSGRKSQKDIFTNHTGEY